MKNKFIKFLSFLLLICGVVTLASCDSNEPETPETPEEPEAVLISDRVIYVSPTGSGSAGTKEAPCDFATAITQVIAGNTILLAEGVYKYNYRLPLTASGLHYANITVKPEVEGSEVVFDFSAQSFDSANRGIQIYGDYWHFYDIDVRGAGDNGLYICGNNNKIENCQFYNNRDSGLQLGRGYSDQSTIDQWPSNNLILNCTSFNNYDDETLGENADGFAAKLTVGYGNIFDGCIAFRNSDDGWDLYGKEDSGNIGNVILYNCVSFENGYVGEPIVSVDADGNETVTYNTPNGDGIGFKLGGSTMEGDVFVENCIAFNNKLHGFSDNSNPGVIQLRNCTAFNNCIGLNEDGTVSDVRGIKQEENKSNNFDLARSTDSYNSYYGLLSYITNQENYEGEHNEDAFRGSAAYSIFNTSYDEAQGKEIYVAIREYMDATSYAEDSLTYPTETIELGENIFADMQPVNALEDRMFEIDGLFRNADYSVNLGDLGKVVDSTLLTFVNGSPIGASLSKASMSDYEHPGFTVLEETATEEQIALQNAYDVLEVLTNPEAVYQNFELPAYLNECDITWTSGNTDVIEILKGEKISLSAASYITAKVNSPSEATKVTLTATIHYSDEATMQKTFEVNVLPRNNSLGEIISNKTAETFIVGRYQSFNRPVLTITDASSTANTELDSKYYDLDIVYEYALERGGNYVTVDDIYTSVPGVFRVITTATSKIPSDNGKQVSYEYFVYIGNDECDIDFIAGVHEFNLNANGFNINATLTNITGRIHVVVTDLNTVLYSAEEVLNHADVQVYNIYSDQISFDFEADNSSVEGYRVYYVISDRTEKNLSGLYTKTIKTQTVSTQEEFYKLAQGITQSSKDTIYHLTTDLDFADYEWQDATSPASFVGTFNGNGHTISNVTITTETQKQGAMFYKLEGGTIINTNFTNIKITNNHASAKLVGIVGAMSGGYISNVDMTNVSVIASGVSSNSVAALVGQIINGKCYIDYVTLTNDENQVIRCGNKYMGGIVGNIQLDSGMVEAKVYISYCVVKADIGDGEDSGGCHGGIVGRVKNDTERGEYYVDINNCYYKGTINTYGNYNAGILGSVESGSWPYALNNNYADVVFIYRGLVLDATSFNALEEEVEQEYAHKNCNPICGRASTITTDRYGDKNAGSWKEYYSKVITSTSFYFTEGPDFVPDASYFETACGWNLEKWTITETGDVFLK